MSFFVFPDLSCLGNKLADACSRGRGLNIFGFVGHLQINSIWMVCKANSSPRDLGVAFCKSLAHAALRHAGSSLFGCLQTCLGLTKYVPELNDTWFLILICVSHFETHEICTIIGHVVIGWGQSSGCNGRGQPIPQQIRCSPLARRSAVRFGCSPGALDGTYFPCGGAFCLFFSFVDGPNSVVAPRCSGTQVSDSIPR